MYQVSDGRTAVFKAPPQRNYSIPARAPTRSTRAHRSDELPLSEGDLRLFIFRQVVGDMLRPGIYIVKIADSEGGNCPSGPCALNRFCAGRRRP
jgi:hypothetical protein